MRFNLIAFILLLFSMTTVGWAQPQNPAVPNPDAVPITGLEYLLVAGGLYGVKRFSKKKQSKTE